MSYSGFSVATTARQRGHSRYEKEESLNDDLMAIEELGGSNMVKFISSKTQCTIFSLRHSSFYPNLQFNNINLSPNDNLYMLGLLFSSDLTYGSLISCN